MLTDMLALLGSCAGYGISAVMQAVGARRRTGLRAVFTMWYLLGIALNVVAFGLSIVALQHLPLFLVNSVLAASVAITVLVARFTLGTRMRGWDVVSLAGVIVGTGLLTLAAGSETAVATWPLLEYATLAAGGVLVTVTIALWLGHGPGWALALCSGLGFALMTFAIRAIHGYTPNEIAASWAAVLAVVTGIAVTGGASLLAFQRANVGMVVSVQNGVSVVCGVLLGLLVLNDTVTDGRVWALVLGVLVIIAACTRLSFSPAMRAVS